MRPFVCLALGLLAAAPLIAEANCYSVYDAQNRLIFQSPVVPIDLSMRIGDAMRARFPSSYLVMVPDDTDCRELRTAGGIQPRFDSGRPSQSRDEEQLQASPLLRGTRATGDLVESGEGAAVSTREAVRSGNVLNLKREGASR